MKICGFRGEKEVFEERSAAMNYQILFNPYAKSGHGANEARALDTVLAGDQLTYTSMPDIRDYAAFFASIAKTDRVLIAGGDGTLNRFINDTAGIVIRQDLYYYPTGSGNDFWNDVTNQSKEKRPIQINKYLRSLPTVDVNGKTSYFLNGIGYGIDGYCCEKGDEIRQKSTKPVNYTMIALRGLIYDYQPTDAVVTVDGVKHVYHKCWLAPAMNGRFYGGGIMPTPAQDRLSSKHELSVMIYCGDKFRALALFPKMFKGEHVAHTNMVHILSGREIQVEFSRPTPLQIDGETVHGVTEYRAVSSNGRSTMLFEEQKEEQVIA